MRLIFALHGLALATFTLGIGNLDAAPRCQITTAEASKHPNYKIALGNQVSLSIDQAPPVAGTFLGRLIRIGGETKGVPIHVPNEGKILLVPGQDLGLFDASGRPIAPEETFPVVRSVNQWGGTCAAFTIFNCLRQMHYRGFRGNNSLPEHLRSEEARWRLFLRIDEDYYKDGDHRQTEEKVAAEMGFKIYRIPSDSSPSAFKTEIDKHLRNGWPVMVAFKVGQNMSRTTYAIHDLEHGNLLDQRLWTPTTHLQSPRSSYAGHQVLIVGSLEGPEGRSYVVIDPNWQAPRLWAESEFNDLYSPSIEAWVMWQDGPNSDAPGPNPPRMPAVR